MKFALKLLIGYMLFFTTLSTLFIVYILRNVTNRDKPILQNILCTSGGIRKEFGGEKENIKVEDDSTSLNEIISSIKNRAFKMTGRKSSNDLHHALRVSRHSYITEFKKPLTPYKSFDYNLMQSLLATVNDKIMFDNRLERQIEIKLKYTQPKRILVLHGNDRDLSNKALIDSKCNVKNCIFTNDHSLAKNVDAIIFHGPQTQFRSPFANRHKQIWIYHTIESPVHMHEFRLPTIMNWTATYRSSSVIPTPYAKFRLFPNMRRLPKVVPAAKKNYAESKSKLAAIFLSNCFSANGRMDYIKELRKFARVDVFGECGDKTCRRNDTDCFQMLSRDYKFYLSFENSNCREYITEKFFYNALQ